MTYATGSGTLQAMLNSLATFALANGWAPHTPAPHRYWSILGRTNDSTGIITTEVDFFKMAETPGGANVLSGGTASATGGTPDNALADDGTLWSFSSGSGGLTRWTYDFGAGNEKSIVEITINFGPTVTHSYRYFDLQYSDDGSTWYTLKGFHPNVTLPNETFVGLWTNTSWPLTPDGDNFLDFVLEDGYATTGYTLEGGSFPIDNYSTLYVNIGREQLAPINFQGSTMRVPTEDIEEWHFFGDDTLAVHLHVAFRITYRGETFWHHLSAGEINKKGQTHNGVAYCTTSLMCSMVESFDNNSSLAHYHHTLDLCGYFTGNLAGSVSSLCWRLTQTGGNFPYPNDGNFPARESTHLAGLRVMPVMIPRLGARRENNQFLAASASFQPALGYEGWRYPIHPTTGFVSLGVLPFVVANADDAASAELRMLGEYPNVRSIRIDNLEPGDEVTIGADVWKCFPLLRKVSAADGTWPNRVAQSGPAGIAYKKVVA